MTILILMAALGAFALVLFSARYGWDNALVVVLALPRVARNAVILAYERIAVLWKSREMRVRNCIRRLRRRTVGAVDVYYTWDTFPPVAHLIFKTDDEARRAAARADELTRSLTQDLVASGIPEADLHGARVGAVSQEEIARGGGGFHYWRDRGL